MSIFLSFCTALLLVFSSCKKADVSAALNEPGAGFNVNAATLLAAVNAYRSTGQTCGSKYFPAVPLLQWNTKLATAAAAHSLDMKTKDFFSHTGSNGSDAGGRLTTAGYHWQTWAENIARGYSTEQAVVEGWINSPGHCENIMNATMTEMGVARNGSYWTQVFGKPR